MKINAARLAKMLSTDRAKEDLVKAAKLLSTTEKMTQETALIVHVTVHNIVCHKRRANH